MQENTTHYVPGYRRTLPGTKFNFGGSMPSAPKPPAPPTAGDAAKNLLNMGKPKKKTGYASTILTGGTLGNPNMSAQPSKTMLGS